MKTQRSFRMAAALLGLGLLIAAGWMWAANRAPASPTTESSSPGGAGPLAPAETPESTRLESLPPAGSPHPEVGLDRSALTTYTVQAGDTLFGIAQRFGLEVETILSANAAAILGAEGFSPQTGEVLVILPADGSLHLWEARDTLSGVAARYGVSVGAVSAWPGNRLQAVVEEGGGSLELPPGTWLFIPGGRAAIPLLPTWSSLGISRENPEVARAIGLGYCRGRVDGPDGTGTYVWPVPEMQGFEYDSLGKRLYFSAPEDGVVLAADRGVVIFSGWLAPGPGKAVILDHGAGGQTYYGNLATLGVACGESVAQGSAIGALASTDETRGAILAFELFIGRLVDPLAYLPATGE